MDLICLQTYKYQFKQIKMKLSIFLFAMFIIGIRVSINQLWFLNFNSEFDKLIFIYIFHRAKIMILKNCKKVKKIVEQNIILTMVRFIHKLKKNLNKKNIDLFYKNSIFRNYL